MKKILLVVTFVAFALLAACTTTPHTADLRIGMSKEEAIKVMGPPSTVSAQANFEYLNYSMAESVGVTGTLNRQYYVRLIDGKVESFGYMGQFGGSSIVGLSPRPAIVSNPVPATDDGVKILSIEPASVAPGYETTIKVTIKYSLHSQAQANISVGFNTANKTAMSVRENRTVQSGAGEITVSAVVSPVDWGEMADFKVSAILSSYPPVVGSRPLAADTKPLALKK